MNKRGFGQLDRHLEDFVAGFLTGIGRLERRKALAGYVRGLLLDGDRKSIAPIAARLAESPDDAEGIRQRLQQAVAVAKWSEKAMQAKLAAKIDKELPELEALVIDDTGLSKKGEASPGVARQSWGEGAKRKTSRFATIQVRTAQHHTQSQPPGPEPWLLCEWLKGKDQPNKFWLSTLPPSTPIEKWVRLAKLNGELNAIIRN